MNETTKRPTGFSTAATHLGVSEDQLDEVLKTNGWNDYLGDQEIFKFSDFHEAFKDKPIGRVRLAYRELTVGGKTETATNPRLEELKKLGIKINSSNVPAADLFNLYNPKLKDDPITQELKKRYGEKAVVLFKPGTNQVAVNETIGYVSDLDLGFITEQETVMVNGELIRPVPIGHIPDQVLDEDPLFPGSPLRNQRSIVNHRDWTNVTHECRQFCRIIVDRNEIDPNDTQSVVNLLKMATGPNAMDGLIEMWPGVRLAMKELETDGDLPKLKIRPGLKKNLPFGNNRRY